MTVSLAEFTERMEGPIAELMPFIERHRRLMPSFAAAWAKVTTDILDAAEQAPDDVFGLRYEDLLDQPEDVLPELFGFLGEECDVPQLLTEAFRPKDVAGLGDYKTFASAGLRRTAGEPCQNESRPRSPSRSIPSSSAQATRRSQPPAEMRMRCASTSWP